MSDIPTVRLSAYMTRDDLKYFHVQALKYFLKSRPYIVDDLTGIKEEAGRVFLHYLCQNQIGLLMFPHSRVTDTSEGWSEKANVDKKEYDIYCDLEPSGYCVPSRYDPVRRVLHRLLPPYPLSHILKLQMEGVDLLDKFLCGLVGRDMPKCYQRYNCECEECYSIHRSLLVYFWNIYVKLRAFVVYAHSKGYDFILAPDDICLTTGNDLVTDFDSYVRVDSPDATLSVARSMCCVTKLYMQFWYNLRQYYFYRALDGYLYRKVVREWLLIDETIDIRLRPAYMMYSEDLASQLEQLTRDDLIYSLGLTEYLCLDKWDMYEFHVTGDIASYVKTLFLIYVNNLYNVGTFNSHHGPVFSRPNQLCRVYNYGNDYMVLPQGVRTSYFGYVPHSTMEDLYNDGVDFEEFVLISNGLMHYNFAQYDEACTTPEGLQYVGSTSGENKDQRVSTHIDSDFLDYLDTLPANMRMVVTFADVQNAHPETYPVLQQLFLNSKPGLLKDVALYNSNGIKSLDIDGFIFSGLGLLHVIKLNGCPSYTPPILQDYDKTKSCGFGLVGYGSCMQLMPILQGQPILTYLKHMATKGIISGGAQIQAKIQMSVKPRARSISGQAKLNSGVKTFIDRFRQKSVEQHRAGGCPIFAIGHSPIGGGWSTMLRRCTRLKDKLAAAGKLGFYAGSDFSAFDRNMASSTQALESMALAFSGILSDPKLRTTSGPSWMNQPDSEYSKVFDTANEVKNYFTCETTNVISHTVKLGDDYFFKPSGISSGKPRTVEANTLQHYFFYLYTWFAHTCSFAGPSRLIRDARKAFTPLRMGHNLLDWIDFEDAVNDYIDGLHTDVWDCVIQGDDVVHAYDVVNTFDMSKTNNLIANMVTSISTFAAPKTWTNPQEINEMCSQKTVVGPNGQLWPIHDPSTIIASLVIKVGSSDSLSLQVRLSAINNAAVLAYPNRFYAGFTRDSERYLSELCVYYGKYLMRLCAEQGHDENIIKQLPECRDCDMMVVAKHWQVDYIAGPHIGLEDRTRDMMLEATNEPPQQAERHIYCAVCGFETHCVCLDCYILLGYCTTCVSKHVQQVGHEHYKLNDRVIKCYSGSCAVDKCGQLRYNSDTGQLGCQEHSKGWLNTKELITDERALFANRITSSNYAWPEGFQRFVVNLNQDPFSVETRLYVYNKVRSMFSAAMQYYAFTARCAIEYSSANSEKWVITGVDSNGTVKRSAYPKLVEKNTYELLDYPSKAKLVDKGAHYQVQCSGNRWQLYAVKLNGSVKERKLIPFVENCALRKQGDDATYRYFLSAKRRADNSNALWQLFSGMPSNTVYLGTEIDRESYRESMELLVSPEQRNAFNRAVMYSPVIIQGPPGTGKTSVIVRLLMAFKGRVLVVAPSHAAVDNIVHRLATTNRRNCYRNVVQTLIDQASDLPSSKELVDDSDFVVVSTIQSVRSALKKENSNVDMIIIDEYSRVSDLDYLNLLSAFTTRRIVVVGDNAQLPTIYNGSYKDVSTGEMVDARVPDKVANFLSARKADVTLTWCYRCVAPIVSCFNMFYDVELVSKNIAAAESEYYGARFVLVDSNPQQVNLSMMNTQQEMLAVEFAKDMHNKHKNKTIGICSQYQASVQHIANLCGGQFKVSTVDSFQGSEEDFMIIVTVGYNAFCCDVHRANVAISRARLGVVVILHPELAAKEPYKTMINLPTSVILRGQTEDKTAPTVEAITGYDPVVTALQEIPLVDVVPLDVYAFEGYASEQSKYTHILSKESLSMWLSTDIIGIDFEGCIVPDQVLTCDGTKYNYKKCSQYVITQLGLCNATGERTSIIYRPCANTKYGCLPVYGAHIMGKLKESAEAQAVLAKARVSVRQPDRLVNDILFSPNFRPLEKLVFIVYSYEMEATILGMYSLIGPHKYCTQPGCRNNALLTDNKVDYFCWMHAQMSPSLGLKFYNPVLIDVQDRMKMQSLSKTFELMNGPIVNRAHEASYDAYMTMYIYQRIRADTLTIELWRPTDMHALAGVRMVEDALKRYIDSNHAKDRVLEIGNGTRNSEYDSVDIQGNSTYAQLYEDLDEYYDVAVAINVYGLKFLKERVVYQVRMGYTKYNDVTPMLPSYRTITGGGSGVYVNANPMIAKYEGYKHEVCAVVPHVCEHYSDNYVPYVKDAPITCAKMMGGKQVMRKRCFVLSRLANNEYYPIQCVIYRRDQVESSRPDIRFKRVAMKLGLLLPVDGNRFLYKLAEVLGSNLNYDKVLDLGCGSCCSKELVKPRIYHGYDVNDALEPIGGTRYCLGGYTDVQCTDYDLVIHDVYARGPTDHNNYRLERASYKDADDRKRYCNDSILRYLKDKCYYLRTGGSAVLKVFIGKDDEHIRLLTDVASDFQTARVIKPVYSNKASAEHYIMLTGYGLGHAIYDVGRHMQLIRDYEASRAIIDEHQTDNSTELRSLDSLSHRTKPTMVHYDKIPILSSGGGSVDYLNDGSQVLINAIPNYERRNTLPRVADTTPSAIKALISLTVMRQVLGVRKLMILKDGLNLWYTTTKAITKYFNEPHLVATIDEPVVDSHLSVLYIDGYVLKDDTLKSVLGYIMENEFSAVILKLYGDFDVAVNELMSKYRVKIVYNTSVTGLSSEAFVILELGAAVPGLPNYNIVQTYNDFHFYMYSNRLYSDRDDVTRLDIATCRMYYVSLPSVPKQNLIY